MLSETFLAVMISVGFVLGVALFCLIFCLGVRSLYDRVMRRGTRRAVRRSGTAPDPTVVGSDRIRAEVNAREAFDRSTGVFPPFDPRSHQFLHWMRQEWQNASRDGGGSGDSRARHAFYLECARLRFDEIVAEWRER